MLRWSVACTLGGLVALVVLGTVGESRCPDEGVPAHEWLLACGTLAGGVTGAALLFVAMDRARLAGSRIRRTAIGWLAVLGLLLAFLYVPFDLLLMNSLHVNHGLGDVTDCGGGG